MSNRHTIHGQHHHFGWDNSNSPVLTVAPGDSVEFETVDASGGQLDVESGVAEVAALDFAKVNPVTGPVTIDGAEPGDALQVTIESFVPSGWGWTAIIPGFGLLADQFPDPAINIWTYDAQGLAPAAYGPGGKVPLKPFCGTIGLAPGEAGLHSIVPPRRVGGNMDIRDLCAGTELYLPVEVAGALFSVGDRIWARSDADRFFLISAVNICPNRLRHTRTVSWQMSMPRSWHRSSTCRGDRGNPICITTARRITSGDVLKYRNEFRIHRRYETRLTGSSEFTLTPPRTRISAAKRQKPDRFQVFFRCDSTKVGEIHKKIRYNITD
jgi:hypothetical protein